MKGLPSYFDRSKSRQAGCINYYAAHQEPSSSGELHGRPIGLEVGKERLMGWDDPFVVRGFSTVMRHSRSQGMRVIVDSSNVRVSSLAMCRLRLL